MPSSFLYIDTNFPTFTGEESTKEQIDSMLNYLFILVEQLRYSLANLDASNFNAKGLSDISESSTKDLTEQVVSMQAQINQTNQTVAQLAIRVSVQEGMQQRLEDAEGAIQLLQQSDLEQRAAVNALEESNNTHNQKLAQMELWKTTTAEEMTEMRNDLNTVMVQTAANERAITQLSTDVTNIGNDVQALIQEMATLKNSISVDESGNAIFGKTGQRTDINGSVYINNIPLGGEST